MRDFQPATALFVVDSTSYEGSYLRVSDKGDLALRLQDQVEDQSRLEVSCNDSVSYFGLLSSKSYSMRHASSSTTSSSTA